MSADTFTPDEVRRLRALLEIEDIRKVRMLYSQLMDANDLDGLAMVFAEDALCEFGPYGTWKGRKTIRDNYAKVQADGGNITFGAVHANTNHWVELTGPTTAVGRCYLLDVVTRTEPSKIPFVWIGLYDEDYEKTGGRWFIKRTTLHFFWPQRLVGAGFPGPFPPKR